MMEELKKDKLAENELNEAELKEPELENVAGSALDFLNKIHRGEDLDKDWRIF